MSWYSGCDGTVAATAIVSFFAGVYGGFGKLNNHWPCKMTDADTGNICESGNLGGECGHAAIRNAKFDPIVAIASWLEMCECDTPMSPASPYRVREEEMGEYCDLCKDGFYRGKFRIYHTPMGGRGIDAGFPCVCYDCATMKFFSERIGINLSADVRRRRVLMLRVGNLTRPGYFQIPNPCYVCSAMTTTNGLIVTGINAKCDGLPVCWECLHESLVYDLVIAGLVLITHYRVFPSELILYISVLLVELPDIRKCVGGLVLSDNIR